MAALRSWLARSNAQNPALNMVRGFAPPAALVLLVMAAGLVCNPGVLLADSAASGEVTPEQGGTVAVEAAAQAAPLVLPSPVTASAVCPATPPMTVKAARACARATAWLAALRKAAAALPDRREIRMGAVSASERLALAAQLYTARTVFSTAPDKAQKAVVSLLPRHEAGDGLFPALRNPELLLLRHRLVQACEALLRTVDLRRPLPNEAGVQDHGSALRKLWSAEDWDRMAARLNALWLAQDALTLTPEGWLARPESLPALEKAARQLPLNPEIRLLLAEAQLQRGLPQRAVESCNEALRLAPELGRARYIRALAHWRLQQLALAEDDLNASLTTRRGMAPQGEEKARRLRARGAVRMLRREYAGMCEDFSAACALGDCEGLAVARAQRYCLPTAAGLDDAPRAPAMLPPGFSPQPASNKPDREKVGKDSPENAP